jgi:2-oxoglutarate ferredoxin oxidoreductase subunit delta
LEERVITIEIDKTFCKGCSLCIVNCPRDVLAISKERGSAGFLVPEAVQAEACTKCMMCELICPDFAIVVNGESR